MAYHLTNCEGSTGLNVGNPSGLYWVGEAVISTPFQGVVTGSNPVLSTKLSLAVHGRYGLLEQARLCPA